MNRVVAFVGMFLLLAVAVWGFLTVRSFNHFDTIEARFDGKCEAVSGIAGPEDIQINFLTRNAFISSFDRRAQFAGSADERRTMRGAIHRFDINNPLNDGSWKDRTNGVPKEFQPAGLHYYEANGIKRLFVANEARNSVELYDVLPDGSLAHLEQFTEPRLTSPNDVVAIGPRAFYVTNDNKSGKSGLQASIDFLFRQGTGKVLYFNGVSWREAAANIQYANGLALNADRSKLYVAETAGGNIIDYDLDQITGALRLARKIKVDAAVDNINIDEEGKFWIGGHPRPFALLRHQRNSENLAPSVVFSFDETTDRLTKVYSDPGDTLSGSSSAARFNRKLVIGALFEEKFLICDMASPR